MKILWITNTIFPEPSKALDLPVPFTGGWMYGLAREVANQSNIELAVASVYSGKELRVDKINGITYYTIPYKHTNKKYPRKLEPFWKSICEKFTPDIIHIHGTEYPRALACIKAYPFDSYVISIQGIVNKIGNYLYANIKPAVLLRNITFRDVLRNDNIINRRNRLIKYGKSSEKEYFKLTNNVIGRTNFDYSYVKSLNPNIKYHFCNESLRDGFYKAEKWDINSIKPYTLFLSQSERTIKGLHMVLKAIFYLKNDFHDIQIRVAGRDITKVDGFKDRLKLTSYGLYIRKLIRKFDLVDNVIFTGVLDGSKMVEELQRTHIFLCPSSIENSPNSLGEAQLIGTPVIASYVGGIPDMVVDGETGLLYRFEEIEMLAENIRRVFNDNKFAVHLSENGIIAAEKRHNREENLRQTLKIYNAVYNKTV